MNEISVDENGNEQQFFENKKRNNCDISNRKIDFVKMTVTNEAKNAAQVDEPVCTRHNKHPILKRQEECEDWQLLEADEVDVTADQHDFQEIEDSKSETNNNETLEAGANLNSHKMYHVEIEPSLPGQNNELAIFICTFIYALLPLASFIASIILARLLFSSYYLITIIYYTYIFAFRNVCNRGGFRLKFIYEARFWTYLAAYFPVKLRFSKKFNLDPKENYILNYSPHGISAFGSVVSFATNGMNFSKLFPGITARFMVHETSFLVPVMRETFLFRGDCSVNSGSIDHILTKQEKGNLLTIVVGGLAEADLSDPKVLKVVVAQRKGFIKKALLHKANIIPCIAFGENSVFTKIHHTPGSLRQRLEDIWYKLFQFKHPIYYGRGIFSSKMRGIIPYKKPITVVMGDPIMIREKVDSPSQEQIESLHQKYLDALQSLYDSNQDLCAKYDTKLELV